MRFLIALFLVLQALAIFPANAHARDFIIIVNSEGPLAGADREVVREVYLGERKFEGGVKLKPVNHIAGPLKESFLREIVGMSPKRYKLHWIKKVFQEGLTIPISISTSAEAIEFVRAERGAIAYIPAPGPKDTEGITVIAP